MFDEEELVARYRRMQAWVEREREALERRAELPSQRFLRRFRLWVDIGELEFRELLAELREFGEQGF